MIVRELIQLLQQEDPSARVFLSKDGEGESVSLLDSSFENGGYEDGEFVFPDEEFVFHRDEEDDEDKSDKCFEFPAICLYPV